MQAYPSVGSAGHTAAAHAHNTSYSHLPAAAASGFYNAQTTPGPYSSMLQQPYGRSLKQNGQTSVSGLSSAAAAAGGYMPTGFPGTFSAGNNPYAYGAAAYNAGAFAASPSCSSPGFSQPAALDYTYGSYGQNPAYAAYYAPATYPAYMHAAVQAAHANSNAQAAASSLNAAHAHAHAGLAAGGTSPGYQLAGMTNNSNADSHYSASNSNTTATPSPPLKENASVSSLSKKSRSKNRGRRQNNPTPPPEGDMERVFIWNLDETIIGLNLILQDPMQHPELQLHNKAIDYAFFRDMCSRMESLVEQTSVKFLFMEDLYECDQIHVDDVATDDNGQDLSSYNFAADGFRAISPNGNLCMASGVRGGVDWMRKLAFRYRRIKDIYNQYRTTPEVLCGVNRQDWLGMREQIDSQTQNWSRLSHGCLKKIATRQNCTNVLVTQNGLVPAITKLLLFGFGDVFPIENIYSSAKVGKENCFDRIQNRFGRKCTYVVVGSGHEEEAAAKQLNFPFWRVEHISHLVALHHAINEEHL